MKLTTSIHIEKGSADLQDRAEIFHSGDRTIIALADGVGGIAGGTLAAETFVYTIQQAVEHLTDAAACRQLLRQIDWALRGDLSGGQTTGIVAVVEGNKLFGASCGDSEARIFRSDERFLTPLTERTKKFLGTGEALINEFTSTISGTLVIATDGLWKYAKSSEIAALIQTVAVDILAAKLADLSRLKSGVLPDDIAVVCCRSEHD
ncbi:MAG TPA: protein phosphatase 2C domain-containing protein [Verrucomicrobiae bacterium]